MEEHNENINELFICQCHNTEHQLIFSYDKDWEEVFISVIGFALVSTCSVLESLMTGKGFLRGLPLGIIHTSLYINYYNKMPVACQGFNNFS